MATSLQKITSIRILEDSVQQFVATSNATTTITEFVDKQISLADSVLDQEIDFGPITTASLIFIETTQEISAKLNSASNPAFGVVDTWLIGTDNVTSLYLSNSSGTAATVRVIVA